MPNGTTRAYPRMQWEKLQSLVATTLKMKQRLNVPARAAWIKVDWSSPSTTDISCPSCAGPLEVPTFGDPDSRQFRNTSSFCDTASSGSQQHKPCQALSALTGWVSHYSHTAQAHVPRDLLSSSVPFKLLATSFHTYWRPKPLIGNPTLDTIDADLYQLQVSYQNTQAERARSSGVSATSAPSPKPVDLESSFRAHAHTKPIAAIAEFPFKRDLSDWFYRFFHRP